MPRDVSRLARELKKETCPQRVLDEVGRRIAAEKSPPGRWRLAIPFAVAGLVLVGGLSLWLWPAGENARRQARLVAQAKLTHAQIASQAQDALGMLGAVLANAGADSGRIISDRAVSPLRDSLELAKNKIIHHTQL
jgi:hypothetical protein